jgi:type II secretory pathway predicted ATPase ExeA
MPAAKNRKKTTISDMQSRFSFHSMPFTREFAVKDRFAHPQFAKVFAALVEVVRQRMLGAVIAPAGTGKTLLVRAVQTKLPATRYDVRYVDVDAMGKRDMCREIALTIGIQPAGTYPALVRRIKDHFHNRTQMDGLRPVLILDNSHQLRPEVASILRILTNFEMDSKLVLSILLIGQPPLARLLRRADLEDIHGRLDHIEQIGLLSRSEARKYVEHRCRIAGAPAVPFDNDAIEGIYEISRGNMRAMDRLCRKSLLIAHEHDADRVDVNHITEARSVLWP